MKRRNFGLLAGGSVLAMNAPNAWADASLLQTTLTPFGSERAGNADGSIPAWTGGYQILPAGWAPGQYMPSPFDNEASVLEINAQNMAQYQARLSIGTQALMTKYGFTMKVYPTHRTHSLPQDIYNYIASNAGTAKPSPGGIDWGFIDAYGGVPFPIIDTSDPSAGYKIVWNNVVRYQGRGFKNRSGSYVVGAGRLELASIGIDRVDTPYYRRGGSVTNYSGIYFRLASFETGPANGVGQQTVSHIYSDAYSHTNDTWELLTGQGRVRRAPEIGYDTPSQFTDGVSNYDEYYGYGSPMDRYNVTLVGKQEYYIPYHNNVITGVSAKDLHGAHAFNPDLVRFELHRCWIVDLALAPGKRNVMAKRRLYIDEDTWTVGAVETYDGANTLYHAGFTYNMLRPDLPAVVLAGNTVHDLQTGDYCSVSIMNDEKEHPSLLYNEGYPDYVFDPGRLAATAQY